MANSVDQSPAFVPARALRLDLPAAGLAVVLAATTVMRFTVGAKDPLWLDEAFTGAIAGQPTFDAFWRQVYADVNAPLYYLVAHLWAGLAGLSNGALRLPATVFGVLTPLVALLPARTIERPVRLLWSALIACWIPGILESQDARCYTLLLLLGAAGVAAYARLLERPTTRRAALWCAVCALLILTHYHAAILVACQGLAYLAIHRERAVRTWPAALIFLPAAAWIGVHLPRIAAFAQPDVAWYPLLRAASLKSLAATAVGTSKLFVPVAAWVAVAAAAAWLARREPREAAEANRRLALWTAVGVSVAAGLLVVGLGFLRPSFAARYLTPFVPALLLGLALPAGWFRGRLSLAPVLFVVAFLVCALQWADNYGRPWARLYTFQPASEALMRAGTGRLVFFWDHPATLVEAPSQLEQVGGFFFRQAGRPIPVDPVKLRPGEDPSRVLLARAAAPGTGILWVYDVGVRGTAARRHPPRITQIDPAWRCRNFGRGPFGVLACSRSGAAP